MFKCSEEVKGNLRPGALEALRDHAEFVELLLWVTNSSQAPLEVDEIVKLVREGTQAFLDDKDNELVNKWMVQRAEKGIEDLKDAVSSLLLSVVPGQGRQILAILDIQVLLSVFGNDLIPKIRDIVNEPPDEL